jgi:aromatic ring hydroxylase
MRFLSLAMEAAVRLGGFMAACRRLGMSQEEAFSDLRIRQALAAVRREASEAALHRPWDADRIIRESAQQQAIALAWISKDDAKRFVSWVESLRDEDILYRPALLAVERHRKASEVPTAVQVPPTAFLDVLGAVKTKG